VFFLDEGRLGEAAATFEQALAMLRPLPRHLAGNQVSVDSPEFAEGVILANYAEVLRLRGEFDKAFENYERAIQLLGIALGPDHPETLMSAFNLGVAQAGAGRLDAALQNVRRATDSWEQALGAEHPRMMEARTALSPSVITQNRPLKIT
jgi:tetratricopeptide (TPR) repeat protein